MIPKNTVRNFLQGRGCPEHVVRGGLKGLVENWERTVRDVAGGYPCGLDDYLNDMDTRQLIEEILEAIPASATAIISRRLNNSDSRFRSLVVPAGKCLWGEPVASRRGWKADKEWWYFCRPGTAGPELLADLEGQRPETG